MNVERGYLILEMFLLAAVIFIGVGTAVALYQGEVTADFIAETEAELYLLRDSVYAFYEDTGTILTSLEDLEIEPEEITGWMGPYVKTVVSDLEAEDFDCFRDAWGNDYQFVEVDSWTVELRSLGPDGDDGTDDIIKNVDLHPLAWQVTTWELRVLRNAITTYNIFSAPPDLPSLWPDAVAELQNEGYLPPGSDQLDRFASDGWSQSYVPVGIPIQSVDTAGPPEGSQN